MPHGKTGEIVIRGPNVMTAYENNPKANAEAFYDGWVRTGDQGVMDDDGYVNIVGRIKDMIIRGGENVYPREIEEFLYTHPDVSDVQVIGVPSERYGIRCGAHDLQVDFDHRQGVPDLVMEFTGDVTTLFFLRVDDLL